MAVATEQRADGVYRVETGAGLITAVGREPGARNAQITIKATHSKAVVEPVTGWVDTMDSHLAEVLDESSPRYHGGRVVEYRIETHRRATAPAVDVDTPLEKMAKRDKVREVVALSVVGEVSPPAPAVSAVEGNEERRTAHATFDTAEACAVLAYEQLIDRYRDSEQLGRQVARLSTLLLDIAVGTATPHRAVTALPVILRARPVPFGEGLDAWRAAVEADLDAVLGALVGLVQKVAAA